MTRKIFIHNEYRLSKSTGLAGKFEALTFGYNFLISNGKLNNITKDEFSEALEQLRKEYRLDDVTTEDENDIVVDPNLEGLNINQLNLSNRQN